MKKTTLPRKTQVELVEGAMEVSYASRIQLRDMLKERGEVPIIQGEQDHDYFTLMKVRTPFEEAGKTHDIYDSELEPALATFNMLPEFEGQPYLVAKLARQGTAQIGFFQGHAKIYPDENPEDAFSRNVAGYRILLSPNMNPYNLIVGDDVRKQLDAWEIKDIGLDDFGLL